MLTLTIKMLRRGMEDGTVAFDYKRVQGVLSSHPGKPGIVTIPPMNFVSVQGRRPTMNQVEVSGNNGVAVWHCLYHQDELRGSHKIDGYFEYVVSHRWRFVASEGGRCRLRHKECFGETSMIRLPDFVTRKCSTGPVQKRRCKKKKDFSKVRISSTMMRDFVCSVACWLL